MQARNGWMNVKTMVSLVVPVLIVSGCATGSAPYVWIADYKQPASAAAATYLIRPGDLIDVRVFNQQQMSGRMRVRNDGQVTLPFVNDVQAAGLSPEALATQLQKRLQQYIQNPVVTVSVEEARGATLSVLGGVNRPGQYPLDGNTTILRALAQAGGLGEFAHKDRIYVIRDASRIRFRFDDLTAGKNVASVFMLRPGDVLVVE
jgi:polysaccharide biosynthesis/export protein